MNTGDLAARAQPPAMTQLPSTFSEPLVYTDESMRPGPSECGAKSGRTIVPQVHGRTAGIDARAQRKRETGALAALLSESGVV